MRKHKNEENIVLYENMNISLSLLNPHQQVNFVVVYLKLLGWGGTWDKDFEGFSVVFWVMKSGQCDFLVFLLDLWSLEDFLALNHLKTSDKWNWKIL